MWRVFRNSQIPYAAPDYGEDNTISYSPLDPIKVGGSFLWQMIETKLSFVLDAKNILSGNVEHLLLNPETPLPKIVKRSSERYIPHAHSLYASSILEFSDEIFFWSMYFAVKKTLLISRSIFNGKYLSSFFKTPSPVNLADITDTLQFFAWAVREFGRNVSIGILDFRHYFHQLRVGAGLRKYLGVSFGDKSYRFTTLPMGWSFSPYLAQCCSWGVIIDALDHANKKHSLSDVTHDIQIPFFVQCGQSRIFLTYDNVAVIGPHDEVKSIHTAILAECARVNLIVKDSSIMRKSGAELANVAVSPENELAHLGVVPLRLRGLPAARICTPTLERWRMFHAELTRADCWTQRQVARAIGIVLHFTRVQLLSPGNEGMRRLIKFMSRFGRRWDARFELDATEREVVMCDVKDACSGRCYLLPIEPRVDGDVLVAADACDSSGGFIFINASGGAERTKWFDLPRKMHIYLKELISAREAVKAACEDFTGKRILLLEDNSACRFAITRKYSSNEIACAIIREIETMLAHAGNVLSVLPVTSAFQPADETSRKKAHKPEKLTAAASLYLNQGSVPTMEKSPYETNSEAKGTVRHFEPSETTSLTDVVALPQRDMESSKD